MNTLTIVVAVVVASVAASPGQSRVALLTGRWTAQFDGRTFVRLELKAVDGTFTGGLSLGNVEVDKQGALRRVGDAPRELKPIFDVTHGDSTVTFSRKDVDETDRFELRLLPAGQAQLKMLLTEGTLKELAASGIPDPKPFVLTKQ
jgi:hypothetical protein